MYWDHYQKMEMPGIEPGAFHMQSERSTTEPHPLPCLERQFVQIYYNFIDLIYHTSHDHSIIAYFLYLENMNYEIINFRYYFYLSK